MRSLTFYFLILLSLISRSQSLEFYRENLVFSIDSSYFTVSGTYYFRNPSQQAGLFTITYPLPRCAINESIDTLVVFDAESPERPVLVTQKDSLYTFQVGIGAGSEKALSISYRQKYANNQVKYILTTTQYWRKSLKQASYDFLVPNYLLVKDFSYPPDSHSEFTDEIIYHWVKTDFMPEKDFIVHLKNTVIQLND